MKCAIPVYPVAVLLFASSATTVTEKADPAVAVAGALRLKCVAAPGVKTTFAVAVIVLALWLAVSALFSIYVGNFAHYDKTYGSLGAVVGFMMWNWLTNVIILAGAELNSEVERQSALSPSAGKPRQGALQSA